MSNSVKISKADFIEMIEAIRADWVVLEGVSFNGGGKGPDPGTTVCSWQLLFSSWEVIADTDKSAIERLPKGVPSILSIECE